MEISKKDDLLKIEKGNYLILKNFTKIIDLTDLDFVGCFSNSMRLYTIGNIEMLTIFLENDKTDTIVLTSNLDELLSYFNISQEKFETYKLFNDVVPHNYIIDWKLNILD